MDNIKTLDTSLEKLVNNLFEIYTYDEKVKKFVKEAESLDLKKKFPNTYTISNNDDKKFLLLLRKSVYPYNYMDNWDKFNETEYPSIECFLNKLTQGNISQEDYNHGLNVWNTFSIRNIGKYHDLYVQLDTLQLADVYEILEINALKYIH